MTIYLFLDSGEERTYCADSSDEDNEVAEIVVCITSRKKIQNLMVKWICWG